MTFFILSLFHAGYKLRISTIYHLLKGKRTSSVLLFGFFYQILGFLGALESLEKKDFTTIMENLEKKQWIICEADFAIITDLGRDQLQQHSLWQELSALDGFRYQRSRQEIWQLLLFAVQVTSHLSHRENKYLPLTNRPQLNFQIKRWLKNGPSDLTTRFSEELQAIFSQLPSEQSDFLASQFSGHGLNGQVYFQLLPAAWQAAPWNQLYQQNALDHFAKKIPKAGMIVTLIQNLDQKNLNQSMLKSRQLFQQGADFSTIQHQRQLKTGTLNDHLIEWALLDQNFPFEKFSLPIFQGTIQEVLDYRFIDSETEYLLFRLGQIKFLKEQ